MNNGITFSVTKENEKIYVSIDEGFDIKDVATGVHALCEVIAREQGKDINLFKTAFADSLFEIQMEQDSEEIPLS